MKSKKQKRKEAVDRLLYAASEAGRNANYHRRDKLLQLVEKTNAKRLRLGEI